MPPTWGTSAIRARRKCGPKWRRPLLNQSHGKAAGILIGDLALARHYVEFAATFVAIGDDVAVFANAAA
ncbi:hypothetical protein ISN39_15000 [Rhizobium sp. 007]|nr:hypothetical protein ISN39_15000 [Rhizobium sp. 007]